MLTCRETKMGTQSRRELLQAQLQDQLDQLQDQLDQLKDQLDQLNDHLVRLWRSQVER